jgi:hypothetical protein
MLKKFFLTVTLSLLALAPALLTPLPAGAANERGITLTSHKCQLCGKEFYTFKPDSIDCTKSETRTCAYQNAHWYIFKGKRSFPACARADGAHLFKKGSDLNVDPATIVRKLDQIVYVRSGSSLKIQLERMKCMGCGMEAHAFACDDLDYTKPIDLRRRNTWTTMEGQSFRDCSWQSAGAGGGRSPFHIMKDTGRRSINSRELANIMNNVICSHP